MTEINGIEKIERNPEQLRAKIKEMLTRFSCPEFVIASNIEETVVKSSCKESPENENIRATISHEGSLMLIRDEDANVECIFVVGNDSIDLIVTNYCTSDCNIKIKERSTLRYKLKGNEIFRYDETFINDEPFCYPMITTLNLQGKVVNPPMLFNQVGHIISYTPKDDDPNLVLFKQFSTKIDKK